LRDSVRAVHALVSALSPVDEVEAAHRAHVLDWLSGTDDVFRRAKPAVPDKHLVSYVVPVDPDDGSVLLVDHINAGLWLPPGGHVDMDEHPLSTAHRELAEELALGAEALTPLFLTVTQTVGLTAGHTDVSIWYVFPCSRPAVLKPDEAEFNAVRWWSRPALASADPSRFDPHFFRFLAKLSRGVPENQPKAR
jgi:8-oxo-dGTP diphosphatase